MQGKPEGMATSEWQVIPQCVLCPQSDPISFPPNSSISSKHGHFGLQKKKPKKKQDQDGSDAIPEGFKTAARRPVGVSAVVKPL